MDGFTIVVTAFLVMGVLVFLLIGRFHPKTGSQVLDWKPTRSQEDEVRLELEDVDQMLEAQHERRRRAGREELTEEGMQAEVARHPREQRERAREYREPG